MRRPNRLALLLTLPALSLLWLIGWTLYWTGSSKRKLNSTRKTHSSKELTFTVVVPEETIETQNR